VSAAATLQGNGYTETNFFPDDDVEKWTSENGPGNQDRCP
jgi:hypothetical protein